jgi:hypothetical protein
MSLDGLKFKSESKKGKRSGVHRRVKDGLQIPVNRQVYLVWYAYTQFLNKSGILNKKLLKDWKLKPFGTYKRSRKSVDGKSRKISADEFLAGFDEWWDENWKDLFAEKEIGFVQTVDSIPKKPSSNKIYIEVPLDTSSHILRSKCKEIIDNEMKSRKIKLDTKPISTAKYKPDVPVNFDYLVWVRKLSAFVLSDGGMKNTDIYLKLCKEKINKNSLYPDVQIQISMQRMKRGEKIIARAKDSNTVWREVQRDVKDAERVLEYVQKGQFCISKPKSKTKKKVKKK